jgi:glycine/D-amino acid oxidase-like deaminating enzyme
MAQDYTTKSFWLGNSGAYQENSPLEGDLKCDVVIVGGGFAGIATAYFLKRPPTLSVAVLETEVIGFGASGRNAGFAMTTFGLMMSLTNLLRPDKTRQSHRYMERAVDLVGELVAEHHLDCDYSAPAFCALRRRPRTSSEFVKSRAGAFAWIEGVEWIDAEAVRERWTRRSTWALVGAALRPPQSASWRAR